MGDQREEHESLDLPPGFRFHPTDEEIITYYLTPKVLSRSFCARAIGEVDLNKSEPWDLPSKAKMGEKEWYFYCQKDRKYPTGMRTNRATEAGYWKATGKDKEIYRGRGLLVGMKKTLVFYKGRAPKGEKTNWVMHEYRLEGKLPYPNNSHRSSKDEWVVCRIFHKSSGIKKVIHMMGGIERSMSIGEDFLVDSSTLPPLMDPSYYATGGASTSASAPPPSYLAALACFENPQELNMSQFGNPAAAAAALPVFYQQLGTGTGGYMPVGAGPGNFGYLQEQQAAAALRGLAPPAIQQHCKAEQHSNCGQSSMVSGGQSQDTGLSTDHNTTAEISSDVSRRYDDQLGGPSTSSAGMDLDGIWKY